MNRPGRAFLAGFRGAVFDLDGTLVDSEPAWTKAKRIVADRHHRPVTTEQLVASEGRSMDRLIAEVFAPDTADAAQSIKEAIFAEAENWLPQLRKPIPGAADFLRELHGFGLAVALCSSSPAYLIVDALRQIGVADIVEVVMSADPLPRPKPDPMPYIVTAKRLGFPPDQLIAFEDSVPGARSAKDAGLFTVAIGRQATSPELAFADLHATSYAELQDMLGLP
ncbi:HAD family hydrolase [Paracoccus aerodenitrificans]|uniref:HAD family hydrolase n=1 Tax=Paracoccus aerodenitrificans TaxID=3017781 RepID=UPI0022F0C018|nr:HAD family phosphatase [Paracoccus aerodenitrificans]WBU63604.1 HAD family phosphatase [Paracoccus aerodenitrificans]